MEEAKCILFFHHFLQIQPEKQPDIAHEDAFSDEHFNEKWEGAREAAPCPGNPAWLSCWPQQGTCPPKLCRPLPSGHAFMGPR